MANKYGEKVDLTPACEGGPGAALVASSRIEYVHAVHHGKSLFIFIFSSFFFCDSLFKFQLVGQPRWRSGLVPPAAWGVILETRDRVPHRAPCMEAASPSASLSLSLNE